MCRVICSVPVAALSDLSMKQSIPTRRMAALIAKGGDEVYSDIVTTVLVFAGDHHITTE